MVGAIDRPAKDQQQADESQDHAHDQDHLDRRVSWRKPTAQHRTKKSTRRTFGPVKKGSHGVAFKRAHCGKRSKSQNEGWLEATKICATCIKMLYATSRGP